MYMKLPQNLVEIGRQKYSTWVIGQAIIYLFSTVVKSACVQAQKKLGC